MYLHEQAEVSDVVSFVEEAGPVLGYKAFEGGNGSCRFVIYVTTSMTTHGCSSTICKNLNVKTCQATPKVRIFPILVDYADLHIFSSANSKICEIRVK